jgi:basic membrane protein A
MKRIVLALALCMISTLLFGSIAQGALKVGLVTDVGKVDDRTFNEFAYKGMMRAKEAHGIETSFIETMQPTDYEKNIEQFATEGFDVIITVGFMLGDATAKMAKKYPDVNFVIVDFAYDPVIPNVMGLVFAEDQSGFLAGALAGMMTESEVLGVVGGMEIPPVIKFRRGFENGAKLTCPDCETLGVYIDSFTDPARGKTAALSQMDEGADVVFGCGGTTGSGGILGAAQAGAWVVGVDQDEYMTTFKEGKVRGSDMVLTSAMKRVDNAVFQALEMAVEGSFEGGTKVFDASNDGVGLAPYHEADDDVPQDVKDRIDEIAAKLKAGEIETGVSL